MEKQLLKKKNERGKEKGGNLKNNIYRKWMGRNQYKIRNIDLKQD